MKKLLTLSLTLAAAMVLLLSAGDAQASHARRTALGGNQLITDSTDVFNFPQLALDYTRQVHVDYGIGMGNNLPGAWDDGSALLIMGTQNLAYGMGIFHGDIFNTTDNMMMGHTMRNSFPHDLTSLNLGNITNSWLIGGTEIFDQPHTILDLFGAMRAGNMKLGARLAFGHGGESEYDAATKTKSTLGNNFINLDAGLSIDSGFRLDTGLKLLVNFASEVDDGFTSLGGFLFGADLFGRAYMPMGRDLELGVLGNLSFSSLSLDSRPTTAAPTTTMSMTGLGALLGAGPVYRIAQNTTIAGYGILGLTNMAIDPDKDTKDDGTSMGLWYIPGMQIAADIEVLDWLYVRTGVQYSYVVVTDSSETPEDQDDSGSMTSSVFGWMAGLGVVKGNFTLDGVLQNNFLTDGPYILGGVANGLFTTISAGYKF